MPDSIYTQIINRQLPATIHYEDDEFIVIDNLHPTAPIHVLIITKEPFQNIEAITGDNEVLLGKLLKIVKLAAHQLNIADNYKVAINVGEKVQAIQHLHIHLMGGWKDPSLETTVGF